MAVASGRASPANRLQRSVGMVSGLSVPILRIRAGMEGTEYQMLISFLLMKRVGASMSRGVRAQTRAPTSQATKMSKMQGSNVSSKVWEKRSSGTGAKRCTMLSTKCSTLACNTGTPLGLPVLPDVNSRYVIS